MAATEISVNNATYSNNNHPINSKEEEVVVVNNLPADSDSVDFCFSLLFFQKLIAEGIGTFFLMFAGCGAMEVNLSNDKMVNLLGIAITWGLIVMIIIYSIGHISGAHLNPAVTIAFATCQRFPWKQVPAYISTHILGSMLAIGSLRLLLDGNHFLGCTPSGSNVQSLVLEFITTFFLMFVVSGVATDNRAIGELAGIAVGSTVIVTVLYAGPISGASMNPARSLAPAIIFNRYEGLWIYLVGPTCGAVAGAWAYNLIRFSNEPLREIRSGSFLKSSGRA